MAFVRTWQRVCAVGVGGLLLAAACVSVDEVPRPRAIEKADATATPSPDGAAAEAAGTDASEDVAASDAGDAGRPFCEGRDSATLSCADFDGVDTFRGWLSEQSGNNTIAPDLSTYVSAPKSALLSVPALPDGGPRSVTLLRDVAAPQLPATLKLSVSARTTAGARPDGAIVAMLLRGAPFAGGTPACGMYFYPQREGDENFQFARSFFNADAGDGGKYENVPTLSASLLKPRFGDDRWIKVTITAQITAAGEVIPSMSLDDEQVQFESDAAALASKDCPPVERIEIRLIGRSDRPGETSVRFDNVELLTE